MLVGFNLIGCSDSGVLPPPRDRWLSDGWRRTPYIFTEWQGVTGTRTLYSRDGSPVEVIVLEQVSGPDARDATKVTYPPGYAPPPPSTQPRIEYLVNANGAALTPRDVAAGLSVEVDGFSRGGSSLGVHPATAPRPSSARSTTQRVLDHVERFPQIKVRTIHKLGPNGKRELIWKTDIPFEGL